MIASGSAGKTTPRRLRIPFTLRTYFVVVSNVSCPAASMISAGGVAARGAPRDPRAPDAKTPDEEKDVQNAFAAMLVGSGIDYKRETERVEYSSKTYQPDFTIDELDLVIELKICKRVTRESELIAELNDYTAAFKTRWKNIVFVVYDLGIIRDVDQFAETVREPRRDRSRGEALI
jgi:hypothetical protein